MTCTRNAPGLVWWAAWECRLIIDLPSTQEWHRPHQFRWQVPPVTANSWSSLFNARSQSCMPTSSTSESCCSSGPALLPLSDVPSIALVSEPLQNRKQGRQITWMADA